MWLKSLKFPNKMSISLYNTKFSCILTTRCRCIRWKIEKESQMNKEKKNALPRMVGVIDSAHADILIGAVGNVVRIKRSHLENSTLKFQRSRRQKGKCKKNRFRDLDEAIETLHRIQRYRNYSEESGAVLSHRREIRAYWCPSCLGAHLTSQAEQGVKVVNHVAA
jgi:hypothetical protein